MMPDPTPPSALVAAEAAIRDELKSSREVEPDRLARAALDAAGPILAGEIANMILRHADENEPVPGSGGYLAWHRHFEAASAIVTKAFRRDIPEVPDGS
jgi:hypothetical protein